MNGNEKPRNSRNRFSLLPAGLGTLLVGCLLTSSGCHESPAEKGEDDAYLRTNLSQTRELPYDATLPLLPLKTGTWWEYQVQKVTAAGGGKTATAAPYRERAVVSGPVMMGSSKGIGITFTGSPQGSRTEAYQANSEGIFLLGATQIKGPVKSLTMSSPLPLLRYPTREGDNTNWDGRLEFVQNTSPGSAYSRVTAWETVQTPAGSFHAWRVDTGFLANINGRLAQETSTRWFVPGLGLVRQESRSRNEQIISVLTNSFQGSKK